MSEGTYTFDWNHARTFLAVADEGSLSGAARALGQTQPTVSRQIAALESSLRVSLFERTGRSVHMTPAAVELIEHVRVMADAANMVALAASGQSTSIDGQVRVTASTMMSAYVLPTVLSALREQAPSLEIDVVADDSVRDLMRREADVAVRHARPEQPNLIMTRVLDQRMRFYASRAYLSTHGEPTVTDLTGHQIISFVDVDRMLGYLHPLGLSVTPDNIRLGSSSPLVAWEMARQGLGMIIAPERVAAQSPDAVPVLRELEVFSVPTWIVAHRELRTSRRIRLVFDRLVDALSNE
ncbi:MAG: LysR family transcriptional regulator [Myxococcota bacterium]